MRSTTLRAATGSPDGAAPPESECDPRFARIGNFGWDDNENTLMTRAKERIQSIEMAHRVVDMRAAVSGFPQWDGLRSRRHVGDALRPRAGEAPDSLQGPELHRGGCLDGPQEKPGPSTSASTGSGCSTHCGGS